MRLWNTEILFARAILRERKNSRNQMTGSKCRSKGRWITVITKERFRETCRGAKSQHYALQDELITIKKLPFLHSRKITCISSGQIRL